MTDKEILDELIQKRDGWRQSLADCKSKIEWFQSELSKADRLIELLEQEMGIKPKNV